MEGILRNDTLRDRDITELTEFGCCKNCCERILGFDYPKSSYFLVPLGSEISHLDSVARTPEDICVVCLGILQTVNLQTFAYQVQKYFDEINLEIAAKCCLVDIPRVTQIRERVVLACLSNSSNLPSSHKKTNKWISIADCWEHLMNLDLKLYGIDAPDWRKHTYDTKLEISISYAQDHHECIRFLKENGCLAMIIDRVMEREAIISNRTVQIVLDSMTTDELRKCAGSVLTKPSVPVCCERFILTRNSIFIGGRYTKLSRKLCQTPWFIQGIQKMDGSVQNLICDPISNHLGAESYKFLSSGREDVDVRMLLHGRPFAIEFVNPKSDRATQDHLRALEESINGGIEQIRVNSLKNVRKDDLKRLKEGERSKNKFYRALCIVGGVVREDHLIDQAQKVQGLIVTQRTPVRVLHRRTACARQRMIHEIRIRTPSQREFERFRKILNHDLTPSTLFIIDLKTQAGTYIKEFIHGEFGRTVPSLSTILGSPIDILALDVTHISLEWP